MSFTDIFIRRPVLASVVSLLILLIGLSAAFNLQVRQYPELSNTTITITTTYPGANADVIKGFITVPIQQAVASAEGIDTLTSTSRQNISTVTLNLRLGLGEESHAPAIAGEPGHHSQRERACIPERVEQARPCVELAQPAAAPCKVVALLGSGLAQRGAYARIPREERLPAIERLRADFARVVHAHEPRGKPRVATLGCALRRRRARRCS